MFEGAIGMFPKDHPSATEFELTKGAPVKLENEVGGVRGGISDVERVVR